MLDVASMPSPDSDSGTLSAPLLIEARFHPEGREDKYVRVGWIVCRGARVWLEITPRIEERLTGLAAAGVVESLRRLAVMSGSHPVESLRSLDDRHWSFVLVPIGPTEYDS
jgi:hypothetical protein